jgi:hypothetical protein
MYLTAEPTTFANPITTPSANPVQTETAYRSGNMYGFIRVVDGYPLADGDYEQGHIEATYGKLSHRFDLLAPDTYIEEIDPDMTEAGFLAWLDSKKY